MTEPALTAEQLAAQAREKARIAKLIAYRGTVELLNATWSLDSGRTVELRLCGDAYDRVHPFKQFQKKRNGRVGTRFSAVFSRVEDGAQLLAMEVMLAAWKDSSSIGQSITLWLDNEVEVHPFCGCQRRKGPQPGDVFALILVELNDDDSPVKQHETIPPHEPGEGASTPVHDQGAAQPGVPASERESGEGQPQSVRGAPGAGRGAPGSRKPRSLSSSVHLLVTSPRYVQWLQETKSTLVKQWTPELARQYTKKVVKVESLGDLDRDQEAVKRFYQEIRRPYERWLHQEP